MARPNRIEYPGAWYYIVNQAAHHGQLFTEKSDYEEYLRLLAEATQVFSIEIHAYSLLKDQVHLLVHTPKGELSRAMRHINGIYTQNFNKKWNFTGNVFSGRYQALLIDPDSFLSDAVVQVHTQPVVAGVVYQAINHAWTSHRYYEKPKQKPLWLQTDRILRELGFVKKIGFSRLNKKLKQGCSPDFLEQLKTEREVIGSTTFKEFVAKRFKQRKKKQKIDVSNKQKRALQAKEILNQISSVYQVPLSVVKSTQSGVKNEARSMAVYQLRNLAGLSQKEIAKHLNSKNPYTVAKVLERMNTKIEEDHQLREKVKQIADQIRASLN